MIQDVWGKLKNLNDQGVLDAINWMGGNIVYVDGVNGDDARYGNIDSPLKTLEVAYALLRSGKNDAIAIKADPLTDSASTATVRVGAAFVWNKPATHLIGMNSYFAPTLYSPRARLAPTAAATAFSNFFTVDSATCGCLFRGVEWFHDFTVDTTNQIAVTVKGARNVFQRCSIVGCSSAADAGARSLLLTSGTGNFGENLFEDCTIGGDGISRSGANANLELAGQTPRNYFRNCRFISWATAAGVLQIIVGATGMDRETYLENCKFLNYGTALTKLSSVNGAQGGSLVYENPVLVGIPIFGDTAHTVVIGYAPSAGAGIAVAPTA